MSNSIASIVRSSKSVAFQIVRPKAKVLHMQDRTAYMAHRAEQDKLAKIAADNLARASRIKELSDMLYSAGLPRFLREPTDIRETVKWLASDADRFNEACEVIRFAGTYEDRQEAWADLDKMLGLTLEVETPVEAQ